MILPLQSFTFISLVYFYSGGAAGNVSLWQVPLQPDKEFLRKMVKVFLVSEKQHKSSSSMESRIAALESTNLMEFSKTRGEKESPNSSQRKLCDVCSYDDILKACERPNQNGDESVSLMFESNGHSGVVSSLAFNSNGKFLATGCSNGIVNIWSTQVIFVV